MCEKNEKNDLDIPSVGMEKLCKNAIELIQYARQIAVKQINLVQLMTYYAIGKWIVEEQQSGTNFRNTVSEIRCREK